MMTEIMTSPVLNIIAPLEQEGTKAVVRTWLKANGAQVKKHDPVVELETDKVVVEVAAPGDGILEIVLPESSDAEPGALLGRIQVLTATTETVLPLVNEPAPFAAGLATFDPQLRLSPAVRRLLLERGLDPSLITGTGRGGRLTREDVKKYALPVSTTDKALTAITVPAAAVAKIPSAPTAPSFPVSADGGIPRVAAHVPHDGMRRKIAEHMQHSVTMAPHVTSVFEADFSAIIAHRNKHKKEFAAQGINLTFTAYFVLAAVQAMEAAPTVNSRWHDDFLEVFKDINLGIGTALGDKGLIVPVIHRAQELSLQGIAARLQDMTEAARAGKLSGSDVRGGTFTLSNHGTSGSLFASPIIINQPQSAILGIGALEKRVVVRTVDGVDCFQVRPKAYVSLTIDHRLLDGSVTNAWLSRFVEVLESWSL